MRKLYLLKTFLLACLFSIVGGGMAWAETETLDFSKMGLKNEQVVTSWQPVSEHNISVSFQKAGSSTAPAYYNTGTAIRVYKSGTFVVSVPEGKVLQSVVMEFGSGEPKPLCSINPSTGSYIESTKTWTPSSEPVNSVTFTVGTEGKHRRIKALTITYENAGGETLEPAGLSFGTPAPSFLVSLEREFTAPRLSNPNGLNVTYASSNEDVVSVDPKTGKVSINAVGTAKITASSEATDTYSAGSASYTVNVVQTTNVIGLAGLRAKTNETAAYYSVNVTNAVVTYVNDKNAYLQTAEGAVLCYGNDALGLAKGQKYNGTLVVKAELYNSLVEITSIDTHDATVGEATAEELTPQVVTVAQIIDTPTAYESRYVTIKDAQVTAAFSNKNAKISQEGKEYALRQNGKDELSVNLNDIIDVTGFPSIYGKTLQFSVYEQAHIVTKTEVPYFRFAQSEYSVMDKSDFDAPAVETNVEGTPAYTSSNHAVATVDGKTGAVTLVGVGTTVITATLDAYNASYTLTVTPYVQTVFVPVVDQSEVVAGGTYIVLNEDGKMAMGENASTEKYLTNVAVTLDNGLYTETVDGTGEPYAFTLVASGDYFKFQHGGSYLQWGGSSTTTLWKTASASSSSTDNFLWKIDLSTTRNSPITNKKDASRYLGYNITSLRFATYSTSATNCSVAVLYRQYVAQDFTLTIGEAGYATFYSDKALAIPAGMEATTVTAANNDGTLTMGWEYQAGSVVPAGTAVLLRGAANSYPTYLLSDYPVAAPEGNMLHGSVEAATTEGGAKYYKLTYATIDSERVLGFFWGAEDGAAFSNAAGKAYLALPAEAAANGYRLDGGDVTGIGQIATDAQGNGQVYSISGVRMDGSKRLPAGIYVINGRKVIVK